MAEPRCARCSFRAVYDRKPSSIIGRLWKWHTRWCPGWRAYMKSLPEDKKAALIEKYSLR